MDTKKRLLTLAAALFISLTACEGLPTEPTLGLETGEVALSLHDPTTVIIDFEMGEFDSPLQYKQGGFTLSNSMGLGLISEVEHMFYAGSTTVLPSLFSVTELKNDDEKPFDVASIDIIKVLAFTKLTTIEFTGIKAADGSLVVETFRTDGSSGLEPTFLGFTNLRLLSWVPTAGPAHFDNITITFSPDPQTRADCMRGGWWETFDPPFRNQGQCVRFMEKNDKGKNKER